MLTLSSNKVVSTEVFSKMKKVNMQGQKKICPKWDSYQYQGAFTTSQCLNIHKHWGNFVMIMLPVCTP